jgi:hypothetical protein
LNRKGNVTINKKKAKPLLAGKRAQPNAKFETEKAFTSKTASLTF